MDVRVRFFATLRDAAGRDECWLVLGQGASGLDAKMALVARYSRLGGLMNYARLAVNQEYQAWETPLRDGDEIGLLPPVSGG